MECACAQGRLNGYGGFGAATFDPATFTYGAGTGVAPTQGGGGGGGSWQAASGVVQGVGSAAGSLFSFLAANKASKAAASMSQAQAAAAQAQAQAAANAAMLGLQGQTVAAAAKQRQTLYLVGGGVLMVAVLGGFAYLSTRTK